MHDQFFHVSRVKAASPALFARSVLQAIAVLEEDIAHAPSSLADDQLSELDQSLRAILAFALALPRPRLRRIHRGASALPGGAVESRWIRGHQIFAVLTQGLILAFNALQAATPGSRKDRARAADLMAQLLRGSAQSLLFTGDFPPELYDVIIRDSMCPPNLPAGFSGLLSDDHRHLVRCMKLGRSVLDHLQQTDLPRHQAISAALAHVYDSHSSVCSQFGGSERTSLLLGPEQERSGVEQINKFKSLRQHGTGLTTHRCPAS